MAEGAASFFDGLPHVARPFVPIRSRIVRDLRGLPPVLAHAGDLELRLATTKREIRKAQRLRFHVFYEDGGAAPTTAQTVKRRDTCPFDRWCDHLLVIDTAAKDAWGERKPKVVGTYRLLRDDVAAQGEGFYSGTEFEVDALLRRHPGARFLELGRSCVRAPYRSKRVIDLLWRGIGIYAAHHGIDVLMGCSSLPGSAADLALPLSYARHFAGLDMDWQVEARAGRALRFTPLPPDTIDPRRALTSLPPLMKAYVRTGGRFAADAVVDHQFGTVDLFTVLPLTRAEPRYLTQFAGQLAARLCN